MPISVSNDVIFGSGEGSFGRSGTQPESTVLSDGRIALVWSELQYPGDGSVVLDYDTWTRILNPDGTPATEAMLVNDISTGAHAAAQVAALSDGGYAVTWLSTTRGTVEGSDRAVYVYDAHVRSFGANGTPDGASIITSDNQSIYDPTDYNTILASNVETVNIVSLAGGGAVSLYTLRGGDGAYDEDGTWAQIVDNGGQREGDAVRIWQNDVFSAEFAQLTSGDLVFLSYEGELSGYSIRLSGADLVSAPSSVSGASEPVFLSHDPQPDQNGGGYGDAMRVAALSDGGFAVLYGYNEQLGTDGDESLRIDRFDAAGSHQMTVTIPTPDDTVQQAGEIPYHILGLEDGRLLVAWSHAVTYGDIDIMAVVVNADGSLVGEPQTINPNQTGLQQLGDLSQLSDEFVFMTLSDASGTQVGGVADLMHGVFLDLPGGTSGPSTTPTGGDDLLTGTPGSDVLNGQGGNDTILGLDGTDTLIGGDGNDVITGGETAADLRDNIYGGQGNDSIDGGYGNDQLRGDAGNDTLTGGFGTDTVIGGDGDDVLTAQAWGDLLFGGDGDDFINGGFGYDRANGGDGADVFFHLGVAGHGSDWIQDYDAAEGDVLQFGGSGASRSQFQVNFIETGNAGEAGVEEAFVIYRPTGQILWALVDGGGQAEINLLINGTEYDLLA